jgi:hypothetical protein
VVTRLGLSLKQKRIFGLSVYGEITEGGEQPPEGDMEVGGDVYPINTVAILAP